MMGHLAEKLVKKGHDVTLVLPANLKIPPDVMALKINTMGFNLKGSVSEMSSKNPFGNMPTNPSFFNQLMWDIVYILPFMRDVGYNLIEDTDVMTKLADKKLDFMVVDPVVSSLMLAPLLSNQISLIRGSRIK